MIARIISEEFRAKLKRGDAPVQAEPKVEKPKAKPPRAETPKDDGSSKK